MTSSISVNPIDDWDSGDVRAELARFCKTVFAFYEKSGRKTLPWRVNTGAWGVLVSECMLQQTQVERVIPYWEHWLKLWPNPAALAGAPLAEVLRCWSGLGYNRRARNLWECAKRITDEFGGAVPQDIALLRTLPGIGPYSASAVACFAFNQASVFIETNIRAALIDFFFSRPGAEAATTVKAASPTAETALFGAPVPDAALAAILENILRLKKTSNNPAKNPRLWYWALMDYGAAVKKERHNPARRSAAYSRQSRFEGSFRQRRGQLVRSLAITGPASAEDLRERTGINGDILYEALAALEKDMLVACKHGVYMITT
ncbi:MAG: A/G-specific adenine glycosylase [Spirochaetaceae bacterium]|jgi:A/G-specific adenine glycosylase|nr:A/G-specific adenine glycosylase [Spirochaetaceae bacterium]